MLATAKWSLEDYHRIVAAGVLENRTVELIDGDIVERSPEGEAHAYSSDEAGEYLIHLLGDRVKVRQAKPITLPQSHSEPEPDIAIVKRLGREYRQHHPYPGNIFWLIEYAESSLKKDLEIKTQVYAAAGIPEYWVINLLKMKLVVLRAPTQTGYEFQTILKQGVVYPLAFPEIAIEVKRLVNR